MTSRSRFPTRGRRPKVQTDSGPDLFAQVLDAAVKSAFESGTEVLPDARTPPAVPGGPVPDALPPMELQSALPETAPDVSVPDILPARMLNEFVYCPRLFYYEHVEGIFVDNADTVRGQGIHKRVDAGKGELPAPDAAPETIHSRSVSLGSDRLGVTAKLDLVENAAGDSAGLSPVDYKAGEPRKNADGIDLWPTDRMQLGLQILLLRENGYVCDSGIIYYRGTRQRVPLEWSPDLEQWIHDQIRAARRTAIGSIPPPLTSSPKCARCSLNSVCLPDETLLLASGASTPGSGPRRLLSPRDDARALYLNTPGLHIGRKAEMLVIKDGERTMDEIRLHDVAHVALFGNIQISTQAIQTLCELGVPVTYFSMGGWFYGITRGHGLPNVLSRIDQFQAARDSTVCLRLARAFVFGKIRNHRTLLMRLHETPPAPVVAKLKHLAGSALEASSLEELLGIEGAAAAMYFGEFNGMLKAEDTLDLGGPEPEQQFRFDFTGRNRRPPTDPVNALLSLAYSLLAKDCALAATSVGLDPYVGYYHQPRHGRPALALDVMEEFRPIIAESAVLGCINNGMIQPRHFVRAGRAVNLNSDGRKIFFQAYEQRMNTLITHPIFEYKVCYRRVIELQFRLLARFLTGEIPDYPPFLTR